MKHTRTLFTSLFSLSLLVGTAACGDAQPELNLSGDALSALMSGGANTDTPNEDDAPPSDPNDEGGEVDPNEPGEDGEQPDQDCEVITATTEDGEELTVILCGGEGEEPGEPPVVCETFEVVNDRGATELIEECWEAEPEPGHCEVIEVVEENGEVIEVIEECWGEPEPDPCFDLILAFEETGDEVFLHEYDQCLSDFYGEPQDPCFDLLLAFEETGDQVFLHEYDECLNQHEPPVPCEVIEITDEDGEVIEIVEECWGEPEPDPCFDLLLAFEETGDDVFLDEYEACLDDIYGDPGEPQDPCFDLLLAFEETGDDVFLDEYEECLNDFYGEPLPPEECEHIEAVTENGETVIIELCPGDEPGLPLPGDEDPCLELLEEALHTDDPNAFEAYELCLEEQHDGAPDEGQPEGPHDLP